MTDNPISSSPVERGVKDERVRFEEVAVAWIAWLASRQAVRESASVASSSPVAPAPQIQQKLLVAKFVFDCLQAGCTADEITLAISEGKCPE